MIKYPLSYNPIIEYWEKIESGEEIVCKKLKRTYQKVVEDLNNQTEYFYSSRKANHVIEFAENFCKHSKGKFGGKPVELELWEKALLATVFGFVDIDGNRKYNLAMLIVAKKNGKSLIASIIGLYLLVGDGESGPEVYSCATKKEQAKIIWQESKRMVKKSPVLLKRIKPLAYELSSEDFNEGIFKPLASDSDTLDGLNVSGALLDEIHQWKNGRPLFDIIVDGITARDQPLIFVTSTAGVIRNDIYDELYDDAKRIVQGYDDGQYIDEHTICFVYELDKRSEWEVEMNWKKANPGLGTIKKYNTLKDKVEKAKQNPKLVKNLVCKEFNIPETSGESWLTWEQINNETTFNIDELKPKYGIGGVDLSQTTDLTGAKLIFMVPDNPHIFVNQMYWIPADLVEKKVKQDKVPYDKWIDMGLMRTCEGNMIDDKDVTAWFIEMQEQHDIYLFKCGYDRWSAKHFVDDMENYFGKSVMMKIAQGKFTLSDPMKRLEAELDAKNIIYNNNPIDKWCLANTSIDEDKNGNIQPQKTSKSYMRIDGTACLLDAYVALQNTIEEYKSII